MLRVSTSFVFLLQFILVFGKEGFLKTDGDILFGGLFPIHNKGDGESACGPFNSNPGYQYMEAMLYALDTINADRAILPDIKLGSLIADTCSNALLSGQKTREFIKVIFYPKQSNSSKIVSMVGPMFDENAKIVANILGVFSIPQVSYGGLSGDLSNKLAYEYFFRTVAPEIFFNKALVMFLKKMGWEYVAVVYSDTVYLQKSAMKLVNLAKHKGVCVGPRFSVKRRTKEEHLDRFIEYFIVEDDKPKVVILMTDWQDSRRMLAAKKRNSRGNELTFVAGLIWNNRKDITQDYEDVAEGIFTFGHRQGSIPEFERYFNSLRYNKNYPRSDKHWIGEYWQETHQCNLPDHGIPTNFDRNCTGDENNKVNKGFAPVQVVINAVYAIANALDNLQRYFCPNSTGICSAMRPISTKSLQEFLKNVTFEDALSHNRVSFNSQQEVSGNYTVYNYRLVNGSFEYVSVGSWTGELCSMHRISGNIVLDESVMQRAHFNTTKRLFTCRPACRYGQIRKKKHKYCCWDCITCAENEIVTNNTCKACVPGFTPRDNASSCSKKDLIYINVDAALAIVLAAFSVLGILTDLVFLTAFFTYRNHPLIKASSREMCCIIFVGIATVFVTSLMTLIKPTRVLCSVRRILTSTSFTICYAPLLMKIWRIHGIFQRANKFKQTSSGSLFGVGPMLGLTFILICINALYSASISSIDPSEIVEKFYEKTQQLVLECTTNTTVFISTFAYNFMLLLGCTVYAFLTRHFPKNFNEAMYIGITLYLTCVVWVVYFVNYLNSSYSISRLYWFSGASLLIGWITMLGLFAPKFYHVYTKPEVSKEMLIAWSESTKRQIDVGNGLCEECRRKAEAMKKLGNGIVRNGSCPSRFGNGVNSNESETVRENHVNNLADIRM